MMSIVEIHHPPPCKVEEGMKIPYPENTDESYLFIYVDIIVFFFQLLASLTSLLLIVCLYLLVVYIGVFAAMKCHG